MFGTVGSFNAQGSRFNNATGSQFNVSDTVGPTAGMIGPSDPRFQGFTMQDGTMPANRRTVSAPMFSTINQLDAEGSTFNDNFGAQFNYTITGDGPTVQAPAPSSTQIGQSSATMINPPPASAPPTVASTPAPVPAVVIAAPQPPPASAPAQSPELSVAVAEARMFGHINRLNTLHGEFNKASGIQVNIHRKANSNPAMIFGHSLQPRPSSPQSHITAPPAPSPLGPSPPRPNRPSNDFARPNPALGSLPSNPTSNFALQVNPSLFAPPVVPAGTSSISGPSIPFPMPSPSVVVVESAPQRPPKRRFFGGKNKDQAGGATAIALGITDYVLTTLQATSRLSNVPFLPEAATLALTLLQGIQGSNDNKDAFQRLAVHACELISSVILVYRERLDEGREMPRALMSSLEILVQKLQPIAAFVTEMHARSGVGNKLKRVVLHKAEANQVTEYREKLTQALAEFGLRSHIRVQDGVAQVEMRLEELVEAMKNIGLQASRPSSTHSESMQGDSMQADSMQVDSMQVDSTPNPVEIANPVTVIAAPSPTPSPTPPAPVRPVMGAVAGAALGLVVTPAAFAVAPGVVSNFASFPGNGSTVTIIDSTVNSVGGNQTTNNYLTNAMATAQELFAAAM